MAYILSAVDLLHARLDNPVQCDLRLTTRVIQKSGERHKDGEAVLSNANPSDLQHEDDLECSRWQERGSAESRGDGRYDSGCHKDGLWNGGGSRQIPAGLRKKAAGGDGGDEQRNPDDGAGSGAGRGGGGGGGGDDGDESDDEKPRAASTGILRRPNTKPLNMEKVAKIRAKLANWRQEVEAVQSVSMRDTGDSSYVVAHTGSDLTDRYVVADSFKRLSPMRKARKDLIRSLATCNECRSRKIKCSMSHHALEDMLIDYPDAADDIRWALEYDIESKQAERDMSSREGLSRIYDFRWTQHDTESKQAENDISNGGSSSPMSLVQWAQATLWSMNSQDTAFEVLVSALAEETHMDLD